MKSKLLLVLMGTATLSLSASALAAGSGLPGDNGRPRDGVPAVNPVPRSPPRAEVRAPAIDLAVKAAQAIVGGCKQYALGVAVVNAAGEPTLIYIPDGSAPLHAYMALRKAYSAITFKSDTSQMVRKAQNDGVFAAQIKADPNLMAYSGGILLKVDGEIVGAIGVSGAEPGAHDEECAMIGLAKIKSQLK